MLNGFMNEDLVYGIVVDGDVIADDNGHETTGIIRSVLKDLMEL